MSKTTLSVFAWLLFIPASALAQQQRGQEKKPPSQSPAPPTSQTPGRGQPPLTEQGQMPRQQEVPRVVFLRGKVLLEDGGPLLEPVKVEMLCDGAVRRQVYTSPKGDFSLRLGDGNQVGAMDASMSGSGSDRDLRGQSDVFGGGFGQGGRQTGRMGTVNLSGCDLRAWLPGFRSEMVALGIRDIFDTDVGVILLHRLKDVEGTTVSLNTLKAPKKARKAYEKARKELSKKKPKHEKVVKQLQKAVKVYPEFAAAWHLLGQMHLQQNNEDGAREAFEKAMTVDPKFLRPYLSLTNLELTQGCWDCMTQLTSKALALNPDLIEAHYFQAVASFQLGKRDMAESSARKVTDSQRGQNFPATHYILGALLAQKGQYQLATSQFRRYLQANPDAQGADNLRQQMDAWAKQGLIGAPTVKPSSK